MVRADRTQACTFPPPVWLSAHRLYVPQPVYLRPTYLLTCNLTNAKQTLPCLLSGAGLILKLSILVGTRLLFPRKLSKKADAPA